MLGRPGHTHWTTRDLARQAHVSQSTVHRIWRGHALQPHRVETSKFTTDAEAERKGQELHVIVDNSSTHTTPAVRAWLDRRSWIHFHFTPKGTSWINLIEAWFGILTRKSIRRGSFDTVRALVKHIRSWNQHPTPFVWTKEPAEIVRKAVRR